MTASESQDDWTDAAWRERLVDDVDGITAILTAMRRIAVIGIKPAHVGGAAHDIPEVLAERGYDVVPVPVYYPEETEMLGRPVHRALATVSPPADLALMFRRSRDIAQHVDDLLAAKPTVVWMQLGISDHDSAVTLAKAGIVVVQDRCITVEMAKRGLQKLGV